MIPTRGRRGLVEACLDALECQSGHASLEVIVVDDGNSVPVGVRPRTSLAVRVIRIEHAGPSAARNAGAAVATGDVLAFTDDDCRPDPSWLAVALRALDAHPDAIVAGAVRNGLPRNVYAETSQALVSFLVDHYEDGTSSRFFTSNNIAVRRTTFDELGGFDTGYATAAAEDRELGARAIDSGVPVVLERDAVVSHLHDLSARSFVRQHYRYGRGAHRFHRASGAVGARKTPEPVSFYVRLSVDPLRPRPTLHGLVVASLLGVSQIAHAAGYLVEWSAGSASPGGATRREGRAT